MLYTRHSVHRAYHSKFSASIYTIMLTMFLENFIINAWNVIRVICFVYRALSKKHSHLMYIDSTTVVIYKWWHHWCEFDDHSRWRQLKLLVSVICRRWHCWWQCTRCRSVINITLVVVSMHALVDDAVHTRWRRLLKRVFFHWMFWMFRYHCNTSRHIVCVVCGYLI